MTGLPAPDNEINSLGHFFFQQRMFRVKASSFFVGPLFFQILAPALHQAVLFIINLKNCPRAPSIFYIASIFCAQKTLIMNPAKFVSYLNSILAIVAHSLILQKFMKFGGD